jgi:predicted phage terminase large subunit-like protein
MNVLSRPVKTEWDTRDFEVVEELACCEARESFWAYRQWINQDLILGWWQQIIAGELQAFYERLKNGTRPFLVIESPPQHGKTRQVTEFVSWASGDNPDLKTIYTSYSDDLGISVNRNLQRLYDAPRYRKVFPATALSMTNVVSMVGRAQRNSSMLEYVGRSGFFRNTTVEGQITGQGLELGLIDDPIKGRAEAQSKRNRDKVWNWLVDDFFTRFAEHAGLIFTMTRWHVDDPISRFLEKFPASRVVRYPAIATKDEAYRKKGEALFPEHKSLEFLLERKRAMTMASWEALYQQHPIVVGGEVFPIEKMTHAPKPGQRQIKKSIRYWDKAGTQGGGAYTAGVLMHELRDGLFVVEDVRHGQWSALEREQRIRQTAEIDNAMYSPLETWVEQEPGSGGLESADRTVSNLRGFVAKKDKVTGSKEIRAEPYAAQVQGGNVRLVAGEWNTAFLDEHEAWPNGKYKDQVDAAAGAFAKLTGTKGSYDSTYSWV